MVVLVELHEVVAMLLMLVVVLVTVLVIAVVAVADGIGDSVGKDAAFLFFLLEMVVIAKS